MNTFQIWLGAARPRTLVLALGGVLLGGALAAAGGGSWGATALTALTAVLLQVLSNLANDYGDAVHGADTAGRVGPERAVQSGQVTRAEMLRAVVLAALLAAVSGTALVVSTVGRVSPLLVAAFLSLGALALWAAWAYTGGSRPYGYVGLGDVMVFLFFGPVAVLGTYFLQVGSFASGPAALAVAFGLLATAVLNVNNMRDVVGDERAGKLTIPVRAGPRAARVYHVSLVGGAFAIGLVAGLVGVGSRWSLLFLLAAPAAVLHVRAVLTRSGAALDPELKRAALVAFAFAVLYGAGALIG